MNSAARATRNWDRKTSRSTVHWVGVRIAKAWELTWEPIRGNKLPNGKLTLSEGEKLLWPSSSICPIAKAMLESLARETAYPIETPFEQLSSRWRRLVFHGTGERWIPVSPRWSSRFQFPKYKGIYPGLDEAARLNYATTTGRSVC
ncbi:MAG: hypothetical protein R3B96_23220 [Pirellulaceae bacterium]